MTHMGVTKTLCEARQRWFWQGLNEAVKNMVASCRFCIPDSHSRKQTEFVQEKKDLTVMKPMEEVSCNNMVIDGQNFLVLVDRSSGFLMCEEVNSLSSSTMSRTMEKIFTYTNYPQTIQSDNATCFSSSEFSAWCKSRNISQQFSSPHHAASNGHAKRAIQTCKAIIKRTKLE